MRALVLVSERLVYLALVGSVASLDSPAMDTFPSNVAVVGSTDFCVSPAGRYCSPRVHLCLGARPVSSSPLNVYRTFLLFLRRGRVLPMECAMMRASIEYQGEGSLAFTSMQQCPVVMRMYRHAVILRVTPASIYVMHHLTQRDGGIFSAASD